MPRPKDTIGQFLSPCTSFRDELRRKGIQPKDHAKENRRRLKELEARNRQALVRGEEAAEQAAKPFATPSKFHKVQPRAFSTAEKQAQRWAQKHSFIHRRSPQVPHVTQEFGTAPSPQNGRIHDKHFKSPLPRAAVEPEDTPERPRTNFITGNIRAADRMTPPRKEVEVRRHKDFGKVPEYLLKRNAEMAMSKLVEEGEARRRVELRPGMRLLPEAERMETLRVLRETQAEVLKALSALPLALTTLRQNQRMVAIEAKLTELDKSIKLFSRPPVYVKVEDTANDEAEEAN
jgi:hypothetical protein